MFTCKNQFLIVYGRVRWDPLLDSINLLLVPGDTSQAQL